MGRQNKLIAGTSMKKKLLSFLLNKSDVVVIQDMIIVDKTKDEQRTAEFNEKHEHANVV